MRKIYKIITFLLCVSIVVLNTTSNCYATTSAVTQAISGYGNIYDRIKSDLQENYPVSGDLFTQFMDVNWRNGMGLLFNMNEVQLGSIRSAIRGYSSGGHDFTLPEDATDQDVIDSASEYLTNNISVSDNSITFNDNSKNMLVYISDELINEFSSYCYSFSMQKASDAFRSVSQYNKALDIMSPQYALLWGLSDECVFQYQQSSSGDWLGCIDLKDYPYLCFVQKYANQTGNYRNVKVYDAGSGNDLIVWSKAWKWVQNTETSEYEWEETQTTFGTSSNRYVSMVYDYSINSSHKNYLFINRTSTQYRLYESQPTVGQVLYQPYYINNSTYQNYKNSVGNYVVNNSNINTVTYGDTTSYIDSFNQENGYPPTSNEININIENTNESNNDDGSGGGSGGSGDDNGGGSGGSGDSSIFDWLKTLGAALGNLIKGVGEFLSEIVAGLVDAVTNLLQAISTLISGVLESLTNIFSGLIEFIYAGLPDDIRNILSLALVVAILITVLKLIRGN